MLKKLDLIQCIIVLLMVVFIPFKGTYPILFTIGGWLMTIGIIIGCFSIYLIGKMGKNIEHRLRMSNLGVNMSLLNSVGIHYSSNTFTQSSYFVISILFLLFAIWLYISRKKWEDVQEELGK